VENCAKIHGACKAPANYAVTVSKQTDRGAPLYEKAKKKRYLRQQSSDWHNWLVNLATESISKSSAQKQRLSSLLAELVENPAGAHDQTLR